MGGPKDWSPLTDRQQRELEKFLAYFEDKTYKGWKFDYAYPGFFSFYHPNSDFTILFTPDWSEKDQIDIQIAKDDGTNINDGGDVSFTVRTAENLFQAVRTWLDKYHPGKGPALGGPKDWSPASQKKAREFKEWIDVLAEKHYRGWELDYIVPGMFVFFHKKVPLGIFFNPDWNIQDSITIEVARRDNRGQIELTEVPFTVRTGENLFAAVKPWLDKYHPDIYKHRPS